MPPRSGSGAPKREHVCGPYCPSRASEAREHSWVRKAVESGSTRERTKAGANTNTLRTRHPHVYEDEGEIAKLIELMDADALQSFGLACFYLASSMCESRTGASSRTRC